MKTRLWLTLAAFLPLIATADLKSVGIATSGAGSGSVTSASVATAHGFSGTVANPTTTPTFTLNATPTGVLKSDGTSLASAASADILTLFPSSLIPSTSTSGFAPSATTDTTNATNITSGALALGRIATIANNTVLGNSSGGAAAPGALTTLPASLVPVFSGDCGNAVLSNVLVCTQAANNFNVIGTLSAATLTLTNPLGVIYGGNGLATATLGDLRYGSAANTLAALAGNTTATLNVLTQTGNGSISAAPVWSTASAAGVAGTQDVQTYTSGANTWTKPANSKTVRFILIGGGGAGGGGASVTLGTAESGGGGGGAGFLVDMTAPAATFAATETCTVGAAATGANGATSGVGNAGSNGSVGNSSTMTVNGTTITARPGGGGAGGQVAATNSGGGGSAGSNGAGGSSTNSTAGTAGNTGGLAGGAGTVGSGNAVAGGSGGGGLQGGAGPVGGVGFLLPGGGGAGGGLSTTTAFAGGNGGPNGAGANAAATGGAATGATGGNGVALAVYVGGGGGAGGGGLVAGVGGVGGNGARGAGGGGGGAASGAAGGNGGNGGAGYCVVVTSF